MYMKFVLLFVLIAPCILNTAALQPAASDGPSVLNLPEPACDGVISLERALASRRSTRDYSSEPLSLEHLSQLLWAAQGITGSDSRFRTAPSAGALHPLEVYVVAAEVKALEAGVYHYLPAEHSLELVSRGDKRADVSTAALSQQAPLRAPAVIAIAAVYSRSSAKYGARANRYVPMDAGHAAQNVLLQATALDLGAVPMGAFDDEQLRKALGASVEEDPLYLIPVGHSAN